VPIFICCLSAAQAQTTINISPATTVLNTGAQVYVPSGSFVNDGTYTDAAAPGTFTADGGVTFSGAGTTTLYNLNFTGIGSSLFSSLVSVYNTADDAAGATVDANNNLWIRSDVMPGANLVVDGVLNNPVQGLVATASATAGCSGYSSLLSLNISGSVVAYQWQSSPDNSSWSDVIF
jgi:hypothetical protein